MARHRPERGMLVHRRKATEQQAVARRIVALVGERRPEARHTAGSGAERRTAAPGAERRRILAGRLRTAAEEAHRSPEEGHSQNQDRVEASSGRAARRAAAAAATRRRPRI